MISEYLLSLVRCPVCVVVTPGACPVGCREACGGAGEKLRQQSVSPEHSLCLAHYEVQWKCPEGALSKRKLQLEEGGLRCECCASRYPMCQEEGYLDLRPPSGTFSDLSLYAEEELYRRSGPLTPPFLSARIKIDRMSRSLALSPQDRVLDIGCGNGRAVFFKRSRCGQLVGIDAGARFAPEAEATVDLIRGDLRRLPFAPGSFDKTYSLDVLEHLSEDGVRSMLREARRALRPGGLLFLYSHVMMSSRLATFQRGVNRVVAWLDRQGLVDNQPERRRKADHRNPLRSYEQLESLVRESRFQIEDIRYYNVVFKAVIEDLLLPLAEHNLWRRRRKEVPGPADGAGAKSRTRPAVGRWAHAPLALATALMKLDVALFGHIRTGPFFLLLRAADFPPGAGAPSSSPGASQEAGWATVHDS